jgi:site-specific DNA-methyltransferase (adenine-specific)
MGNVTLLCGDVCEVLAGMADASVDSIVTDPPYELGFMGKTWDSSGIAYKVAMWRECLRVLKPGGHLLAFGGSRTYHRLASAVEDAGFEIRDQIMWIYGQGFPKSLDVSKAIDKAAGVEREVVGRGKGRTGAAAQPNGGSLHSDDNYQWPGDFAITAPTTNDAKQWDGWGTALKPAHEPICVARKPLIGTVVENVLTHGTGAINIGACRVGTEAVPSNKLEEWSGFGQVERPAYTQTIHEGRWPANVIHDGSDEVLAGFPTTTSGTILPHHKSHESENCCMSGKNYARGPQYSPGSTGSAARFFYCAKASQKDRNEGCDGLDDKLLGYSNAAKADIARGVDPYIKPAGTNSIHVVKNNHPTVKPTDLMRYLCRLVTPPGGTVLDPFVGSGSTGKAAALEGFGFIGIDNNPEYLAIAEARIGSAEKKLEAAA